MGKYRITDNATGHSVVVSGDSPPSPDEVNQIFTQAGLSGNGASQQTNQPPQQVSNPLMDLLSGISKPFRQVAQAAQDIGYSGAYGAEKLYGATGLPGAKQVSEGADRAAINAPHTFLSDSENQQAMDHPVETGVKAGVGVGSYMVPFGQGANIASKVILPAAATGVLSGASQDNATPGSTAKDAGLSTLLSLLFHGAGSAVSKAIAPAGDKLEQVGSGLVQSQYTGANKDLQRGASDAIKHLADEYGLTNINDIQKVTPHVTGQDGVLPQMVNDAISKAGPVDMGGIGKMTDDILQNSYSIPDNQANKIRDMIKRGISASALTEGQGNGEIGNADPSKVFQLIQDLGGEASKNYQAFGRSGNVADQQIASAMTQIKRELQDRLFAGFDSAGKQTGKGADAMVVQPTEDQLNQLHAVSPKLAQKVLQSGKVADLRALQAPFVQAGQAAEHSLERAGGKPISGFESLAFLLNPHMWPALAGLHLLNSNAGKSAIGGTAMKAGKAISNTSAPNGLQTLLDILGARAGANVSQNQ